MYGGKSRRYGILEKRIILEKNKRNGSVSVIQADDILYNTMSRAVDRWKIGGKYKWQDNKNPEIRVVSEEQLYAQIRGLVGPDPLSGISSGYSLLSSSFPSEFERIFPEYRRKVLPIKETVEEKAEDNDEDEELDWDEDDEEDLEEEDEKEKKEPLIYASGLIGMYHKVVIYDISKGIGSGPVKDINSVDEKNRRVIDYGLIAVDFDFENIGPKHTAIIGSTGNGKSVVAYDIVEEAFHWHYPVIVLDPKGQWAGFLAPCTDRNLLSKYPMFGMNNDEPHGYAVDVYTPGSDVGLPLGINLLGKPSTNDEAELMSETRDVVQFIKDYCGLKPTEEDEVKWIVFESWKKGQSLDYNSLIDAVKTDLTKKKLGDLIALKMLFNKDAKFDISDFAKGWSVISLKYLKTSETFSIVSYYVLRKIIEYFDAQPDATERKRLNLLLVIEEAHLFDNLLVKKMIDRVARTLRKKGVGLLIITQRFVDLDDVQTNINTKIYMRTAYKPDLERAAIDIGDMASELPKLKTGSGVMFSPDIGEPEIVQFRPCFHRNTDLGEDEIRRKMHP